MEFRIPILGKLLVLVVGLVAATTYFFVHQASEQLSEVLTLREEFEIARTSQAGIKEVEALLESKIKGVQALAQVYFQSQSTEKFNPIFQQNRDFVSMQILARNPKSPSKFTSLFQLHREDFTLENRLEPGWVTELRSARPVSSIQVFQKKIGIHNSSRSGQPALVTLGVPLQEDAETGNVTHMAWVDIESGHFQRIFTNNLDKSRESFLINSQGVALASSQENQALVPTSLAVHPLVQKSMEGSSLNIFQTQFEDPFSLETKIGAYAKSSSPMYQLTVITQVPQQLVLEPAQNIRREAVRIAGQVLAVAFFLAFLFALSLTDPIETLAELIELVSRGKFDLRARRLIQSNDEVGDLAVAFDHMTDGLKERDKVKTLFSKFHGSSVAEDLIKNDIGRGGTNKNVCVFFSDIRGFTSFSEKRTPEEVVDMLNEYFAVMVSVINKNQGVVDKFIGDAIMAVWGAPKEGPDDVRNAVQACLEMRKALVPLNEKRKSHGHPPIMIGMGLHSGRAISGTIGSEERMEYTVIGDTVNLASRIEASTKSFGTDLLVSQSVVDQVDHHFQTELAGKVEAKGKSEPVSLYKVLAFKNQSGEWEKIETPYSHYEAEKSDKIKLAS